MPLTLYKQSEKLYASVCYKKLILVCFVQKPRWKIFLKKFKFKSLCCSNFYTYWFFTKPENPHFWPLLTLNLQNKTLCHCKFSKKIRNFTCILTMLINFKTVCCCNFVKNKKIYAPIFHKTCKTSFWAPFVPLLAQKFPSKVFSKKSFEYIWKVTSATTLFFPHKVALHV